MLINSLVADRKTLIKVLSDKLNLKPEYKGAPTFMYIIGDYTVMKDGSIEVDEDKADKRLLLDLYSEGFIDCSFDKDIETIEIKIPYEGHTGISLTNLTYLMVSRAKLINRSIRCKDAFFINERFIERLKEVTPKTFEEFMSVVEEVDANSINKGFEFDKDGIGFAGFPVTTNSDEVKAYMDLVSLINKMALTQKRVLIDTSDAVNEKYEFRGFLLRLGMKGNEYKNTRKILLEHLNGNCAFRIEDQAEAFREKHRITKPEVG